MAWTYDWTTRTDSYGKPLVADPLITDTFLLTETSPCIGAATNLNMFFVDDLNGVQRATVWDMGAYEKGTEPHRLLKILKYKN